MGKTELIHFKYYWQSPRHTFYLLRATKFAKKKKNLLFSSARNLMPLNFLGESLSFLLSTAIQTACVRSMKHTENFQENKHNSDGSHLPSATLTLPGAQCWPGCGSDDICTQKFVVFLDQVVPLPKRRRMGTSWEVFDFCNVSQMQHTVMYRKGLLVGTAEKDISFMTSLSSSPNIQENQVGELRL